VLCRVRGAEYLHLVKAIEGQRYHREQPRAHQRMDRTPFHLWSARPRANVIVAQTAV
jgi:hypothetical protein